MNTNLTIKPGDATGRLLKVLPKRTRDVMEQRFGLGKNSGRMTLDAIGKKYGITRERVRQIEADGFSRIKKSQVFGELSVVFTTLENYLKNRGMVAKEDVFLNELAGSSRAENHVYFLLKLHSPFKRYIENDEYHTRWSLGASVDEVAKRTLDSTVGRLRTVGKPVSKEQLAGILQDAYIATYADAKNSPVSFSNWVVISKLISENHFNEWGLNEFPEIKPRGIRDLSHMIMVKSGSPMHFSDVATSIGGLIGKGVHVQTVHNELIKDDRFVLVGRGLYALKNWGYDSGTVKDVIKKLIASNGPMEKENLVELVSKQRFVKPNTIIINLENKKFFKKLQDGRYAIR